MNWTRSNSQRGLVELFLSKETNYLHNIVIYLFCLFSSEGGLIHIVSSKSANGETKLFDSKFLSLFSNFINYFIIIKGNSIRLETEQEEKRLLQEQFHQLEISSNETITKLSKQIENVKKYFF